MRVEAAEWFVRDFCLVVLVVLVWFLRGSMGFSAFSGFWILVVLGSVLREMIFLWLEVGQERRTLPQTPFI